MFRDTFSLSTSVPQHLWFISMQVHRILEPLAPDCRCPPGYQLTRDGSTCRDLDECSSGRHSCQHECVNTEGSYVCVCPPGYKLYGDRCLDVDECVEQQGLCPSPGTCKNTEGSFKCVCPRGFQLDASGLFCVDKDECEDDGRCDEGCSNRQGSYKCGCPEGFQLHLYHNQCVDKDECAAPHSPCDGSPCTNTIGSYTCGCPSGYEFDLKMSICVQSSSGCSSAPCSFGCAPSGPRGFSCSCPRGYHSIGEGHCVASLSPATMESLQGWGDLGDDYEVRRGRGPSLLSLVSYLLQTTAFLCVSTRKSN